MAFDKQQVLDQIQQRVREISLPGSPGNPISAGMIERVIAHEGQVNVVMSFPPDLLHARDALKEQVESTIGDIDGVESVQVLEKLNTQGGAPAGQQQPQGAPGQGPQPQGPAPQQVPGVRHVIAVASGKGGVGKCTGARDLALALAGEARVGLLDSDVYGPSIPKMLGLEEERPEALPGDRIVPIEKHGVKTMSIGYLLDDDAPVIWRGPMVTGLLRQFLFQVDWGSLDYLVVDLPPGTGDAQLTLVQSIALSGGIIVTTPQDVALLDVRRGIQMFQRTEVPILGIVENMSVFVCPHCDKPTEIFPAGGGKRAAERYEVPFLGAIPLDASYAQAGDRGAPTVLADPEASLTRTMHGIADQIIKALG